MKKVETRKREKKKKMGEYVGKCEKMMEKEEKGGKGRREGWEATGQLPSQSKGSHFCTELRENVTFHQEGPKIARRF